MKPCIENFIQLFVELLESQVTHVHCSFNSIPGRGQLVKMLILNDTSNVTDSIFAIFQKWLEQSN